MAKKEKDLKLLLELISGARRSDRELAKALKISQPTVSRKRKDLEKEDFIREYTVIPNLEKLGYEIIAFTFMMFAEDRPALFEKAREWTSKQPCVIFANNGEGLGMNSTMVSVHKNYASYSELITQLRRDWQPNLKDTQSFIVSLARHDLVIKQFSFRHLETNQ
jgi:DNA-binding Lrp family transcriptional regulator